MNLKESDLIRNYLSYVTNLNYKEKPPTMKEFLSNPQYLGNLTNNGKAVYPVWKDTLELVAKEDSKYMYVLTGAIGIGKSFCAVYGMLYVMCRILCLRDPWAYFGRAKGSQMSIVFFNLTKGQSESTAYKLFQNCLVNSPWFKERGILGGSELNPKLEFPLFKYTFASPFVPGFGCLTGDTQVSLLDGRELTIPEIQIEMENGKQLWAYSYDTKEEKMVPGKITFAGKTKEKAQLVRVTLDNGEHIDCTPDHPFMLRDGTYKEAQHLTVNESLMPLYRKVGEEKRPGRYVKNYELFHCGTKKWERTHNRVGESIHGLREQNEVFHHVNFNKRDNTPENLFKLDKKEHWDYHSFLAKSREPEILDSIRRSLEEWRKTPEGIAARKRTSERTIKMNKKESHKKKVVAGMKASKKYKEVHGKILSEYNQDPEVIQARKDQGVYKKAGLASWESMKKDPERLQNWISSCSKSGKERKNPTEIRVCKRNGCRIKFECSVKSSQKYCSRSCVAKDNFQGSNNPNSKKNNPERILIPWNKNKTKETDTILAKTAKKISEIKIKQYQEKKNHRVISVEVLNWTEDVYDITIEGHHNFATTAGVFVHNSQGEHIICALLDEVDSPVASEVQREKVISAYENARRRLDSRFVKHGETIGRFFLVASKQQRLSFLNTFISKYKNSKSVHIVDVPIWLARERTEFSKEEFLVSCGDVYNSPKILTDKIDIETSVRKGFQVIKVPMDYYDSFAKDIVGCLGGETKISLLDGSEVCIKDLIGKEEFWVYSVDKEGNIKPGRGFDARLTGKQQDVFEVELDNGEKITCTGNHPFMLRDGTYKEAQHLQPNESLMPFYTKFPSKGNLQEYKMIYCPSNGWHFIHRLVSGKLKKGQVVHHKDFNPINNSPENLQVFESQSEHVKYHMKLGRKVGFQKGHILTKAQIAYLETLSKKMKENNIAKDPKSREKIRKNNIKTNKVRFVHTEEAKRNSAISRKKAFQAENPPEWVENHLERSSKHITEYNKSFKQKEKLKKLNSERKIGFGLKTEKQLKCQKENARSIQFTKICPYCGELQENVFLNQWGTHLNSCKIRNRLKNHKVKNVKFLGKQDVYDISVEKYHNFALTSGVFVHNSLRDIAGVSVSQIRATKLFPSESILTNCFTQDPNPVSKATIEIGLQDEAVDLLNFIDFKAITVSRSIPRFIHVDYAFSGDGDALGIGMSCIKGWIEQNTENSDGTFSVEKVPLVHTDFGLRIKAPPGDKLPLHKIRKLILDIKLLQHFQIGLVTFDLRIATEGDKQILERRGIPCDWFSMDKNPQFYREFRNIASEGRWTTPWHPYLYFELKNLEDDNDLNKIDHPAEVVEVEFLEDGNTREIILMGSKDIADGVAGSVCDAIQHCITPVDTKVMQDLFDKVKPKIGNPTENYFNLLKLDGVTKESQVQNNDILKQQQISEYNKLLGKAKSYQKGNNNLGV